VIPDKGSQIAALLDGRPACQALVEAVLDQWPDHIDYVLKSFRARTPEILDASEAAASAALRLMDGQTARFAANYRWTCDRLREEEIFFHREERYRLSTFQQAWDEVYSNHDYMAKYVDGLLISQVLWFNHAATFEMFLNRVLGASQIPFDYLEIGPGHGLMVFLAAQSDLSRRVEAWDVSEVSLAETRAALDRLAAPKPVVLTCTDVLRTEPPDRRFDLVVASEVLEHLEQPAQALRFLRQAVTPEGRLFVNVPLNSPSPDHIYLMSSPEEARALIEEAGFEVRAMELFATQGARLDRALANKVSVSAGIIATPA
jgi:2-polyprenyl-3-methyl-5-hydroxy-6-metoxy-1,4-benzoquinol methylase